MLNTLRISFSLKNTYRVNSILYSIRQIPLVKHLLPATIYQVKGFKIFANVLSVLWELVTIFLFKFLYFFLMVLAPGNFHSMVPARESFLHVLLLLTLVGSYMHTNLFAPSRDKYYAMILLRMNARSYTLVHFGYDLAKTVVGFLPCMLLWGQMQGVPLWLCLLIPFCVAGAKIAVSAYSLRDYEKHGYVRNDTKLQKSAWILTFVLLALAYFPPTMGIVLPLQLSAALFLLCLPAGIWGLREMVRFPYYREINKELLSQVTNQMDTVKKAAKTASEKTISTDGSITSRKQGLEYLNELFIKRHRKILWRSTLRIAAVCAFLCCGVQVLMAVRPGTKADINELVMTWLPYFAFIMYLINRGTGFTKALFMNCDHSLLTYSFFKRPDFVLKLFQIRLREIMKINAVPALVIGVGLCWTLYASGGTKNPWNYVVLLVSIPAMSLFFSIHYLTVYYLLQPYTAGTEMKSGTYRIVMILTYVACYALMNLRLPTLAFGAACIVFCVVYSIAACVLVYKFAPRTFRLRT
jgi:hypothetical protein|nr:hypothetical protein [uncultured Oscillibacter sp.]